MTKKEAVSIISKCARQYALNLCDKQVVFVYRDQKNKPDYVEVFFRSNNFMHFTGIEAKNLMKANRFYRDAIQQRLKESNLIFKDNHTTELKLQILPKIMNIASSARMIGDYAGTGVDLYTEKVTGTTSACLGLIEKNGIYIPNTVLQEDIRDIIPKPPGKIFAIFRKDIHQKQYTELTYKSKSSHITQKCLPKELSPQIAPSLWQLFISYDKPPNALPQPSQAQATPFGISPSSPHTFRKTRTLQESSQGSAVPRK